MAAASINELARATRRGRAGTVLPSGGETLRVLRRGGRPAYRRCVFTLLEAGRSARRCSTVELTRLLGSWSAELDAQLAGQIQQLTRDVPDDHARRDQFLAVLAPAPTGTP